MAQTQKHVTYKRREIEGYKKMEEELMDHHMLTFSDLHKLGIRELFQKYRIERSLM